MSWSENIPIISWLIQKGKSRCCNKKLPFSYPLVEFFVGILFVLNYYFGNNYFFYGEIVFLVFSFVFDLKYMILPDFSTLILILLVLIDGQINIFAGIGSVVFLGILYLITKGKGMGLGDVKFAVYMGILLGWPKIVLAFYLAFIVGAIIGGLMLLVKKISRKAVIPFGPFLIMGTIISWWWGERIIDYLVRVW